MTSFTMKRLQTFFCGFSMMLIIANVSQSSGLLVDMNSDDVMRTAIKREIGCWRCNVYNWPGH